tara:strand:- start:403 stop:603 length:201 start_codon:yes stop_codon:yes gene_type:complete
MTSDIYLKAVLTLIASCLVIQTLNSMPPISVAHARAMTHCSGTIEANPYGGIQPNIGGYQVDINCG